MGDSTDRPVMDFSGFVLAAATADLADEPQARDHADAVEFRLDLADDPEAQLDGYAGELPLIATNRAEWEGGEAADAGRLDLLATAIDHPGVEAIDVELQSIEDGEADNLVDRAREAGVTVIASSHEFERTPPVPNLNDRLRRSAAAGDIGKLAVMAEGPGDVLALLEATWEQSTAGNPVATMAMGEAGRHSRVICPLYGSRVGYAPVSTDDSTAPGQFGLATLRSLIETLR